MTEDEADIVVNKIKQLAPNPVAAADFSGNSENILKQYCIGGAVCYYANSNKLKRLIPYFDAKLEFISATELAEALTKLNPAFKKLQKDALDYARDIISDNDYQQFNDAWDLVKAALVHPEDLSYFFDSTAKRSDSHE